MQLQFFSLICAWWFYPDLPQFFTFPRDPSSSRRIQSICDGQRLASLFRWHRLKARDSAPEPYYSRHWAWFNPLCAILEGLAAGPRWSTSPAHVCLFRAATWSRDSLQFSSQPNSSFVALSSWAHQRCHELDSSSWSLRSKCVRAWRDNSSAQFTYSVSQCTLSDSSSPRCKRSIRISRKTESSLSDPY